MERAVFLLQVLSVVSAGEDQEPTLRGTGPRGATAHAALSAEPALLVQHTQCHIDTGAREEHPVGQFDAD